jgi:hypothetical protein
MFQFGYSLHIKEEKKVPANCNILGRHLKISDEGKGAWMKTPIAAPGNF